MPGPPSLQLPTYLSIYTGYQNLHVAHFNTKCLYFPFILLSILFIESPGVTDNLFAGRLHILKEKPIVTRHVGPPSLRKAAIAA